jgi:hypothetical protein
MYVFVSSKIGEYEVELTQEEYAEYKIVENMFYQWQNRFKKKATYRSGDKLYQKE